MWPPSATEVMEKNPSWPEFIMSITGWTSVAPGTLTLEGVTPCPRMELDKLDPLAIEPEDIFKGYFDQKYKDLLKARGARKYYGGIIRFDRRQCVVIVSQQDNPASKTRLEVYSKIRICDKLGVGDNDVVDVDVYNKLVWPLDI